MSWSWSFCRFFAVSRVLGVDGIGLSLCSAGLSLRVVVMGCEGSCSKCRLLLGGSTSRVSSYESDVIVWEAVI